MSNDSKSKAEVAALLDRLLEDEPQAWREVVQEYAGVLQRIVRRTFGAYGFPATNQDVEDATAEAWKNLVENDRRVLYRCQERGNFLQTLHVLARNRAVDLMRKRRLIPSELDEDHFLLQPKPEQEKLPHFSEEVMDEAISQLNEREQTLVRLYFLQEKKYREIAELTGIPRNSIGATLGRAVAKMRKFLETQEPEIT